MSEPTAKKRTLTAETRAKISAAMKGIKRSAETRDKMRAAKTAEHRAKISAAMRGLKRSAETRARMSAAKKGKKRSVRKSSLQPPA